MLFPPAEQKQKKYACDARISRITQFYFIHLLFDILLSTVVDSETERASRDSLAGRVLFLILVQ